MKTLYQQQTPVQMETKRTYAGYPYTMRFFEIVIASTALLMLAPLLIIVCLVVKLDSPGPVFYKQERLGKSGKSFRIIKFRSMYTDSEKHGAQWAAKNDARITRSGFYLRKYRIDELPQLINVLLGEMALVGPRPERPVFTEEFERDIPGFRKRLEVKPGITGWAQVNGGYELSPQEKLELDLYYINHCSVGMDIKIIFKSIPVILFSKGWR